jgi:hypothetical protein
MAYRIVAPRRIILLFVRDQFGASCPPPACISASARSASQSCETGAPGPFGVDSIFGVARGCRGGGLGVICGELCTARIAAAAATSATFLTNRFVSSGVRFVAIVAGRIFSGFRRAEPFPWDSEVGCLSVAGVDACGCSPLINRELILSPMRFKNGSSGILLLRQLAMTAGDGSVGGTPPYSGPWIGISHICAAWVRRENHSPMT